MKGHKTMILLKIAAALLFVFFAVLCVDKTLEGMERVKEPTMCSGPGSGMNSDICADIQEQWSP